jgi:hypothetical protein
LRNALAGSILRKSEAAFQELSALLAKIQAAPPDKNPIWVALTKLKTVHFARFVFLENNTKLAVISSSTKSAMSSTRCCRT